MLNRVSLNRLTPSLDNQFLDIVNRKILWSRCPGIVVDHFVANRRMIIISPSASAVRVASIPGMIQYALMRCSLANINRLIAIVRNSMRAEFFLRSDSFVFSGWRATGMNT